MKFLIHLSQFIKQTILLANNSDRLIGDVDKKYLILVRYQKDDFHIKLREIQNKINSITGLVTAKAPNSKACESEKKIPSHHKSVTAPEFKTLAKINFDGKSKLPNLTTNLVNLATTSSLDTVLQNANKNKREIKKVQTFSSSFLSVKIILVKIDLLLLLNFFAQKNKGLSEEIIKTTTASRITFVLKLKFIHNTKIGAKFDENCLKQNIFNYGNVVNLFTVYELGT